MNKKLLLPLFAIVVGAALYLSLGSKQPQPQQATLTPTRVNEVSSAPAPDLSLLMKHLPNETFAFQTWNFTASSAKIGNGLMVKGISGTIDAFIKADLIPSDTNKKSALANLVVYASGDLAKSFEIGAVATNMPGQDLRTKLDTLLAALKQEGSKTTEETVEGLKALAFEIKEDSEKIENTADSASPTPQEIAVPQEIKDKAPKFIYLAASESMLYANSSKEALSSLIKRTAETPSTTPAPYDSELKRAREMLPQDSGEIGFGLLDVRTVVNQAEKYIPAEKVSAEDLNNFLKNPPISSIAMQRVSNAGLRDRIVLLPPPGSSNTVLTSLISGLTGNISANKTPNSTAFFFSIDGGLLNKLIETAIANAPDTDKASFQPFQQMFSTVKSLSLGIKANLGGSPFPDLSLIVDSTDSAQLLSQIKGMAGDMATQSGMGGMQWQDKTVEEMKTSYMLSPLGVGAFLADLNGSIIIGSSEGAIREAILTSSGKNASLVANLNPDIKARFSENRFPLMYFLNLKALAEMLESTLASFSMFTGGKPPIEPAQLEMLKKSGTTIGFVGTRNGVVEIIQEYQG